MSTRCTVHFHWGDGGDPAAIIYRHGDGYPKGVLPDLEQFFSDVEEQTSDMRFEDPSYLAAKYVVWQAGKNARHYDYETGTWTPAEPLDFISVGVLMKDPKDIEYRYHVQCGARGVVPKVTWEEVDLWNS